MKKCTYCDTKLTKHNKMFHKLVGHNDQQWSITLCPPCAVALLHTTVDIVDHDNLSIILNKMGKVIST